MQPKCVGCKLRNTFTEYQLRRSVTSLLSMRKAVSKFDDVVGPKVKEIVSTSYSYRPEFIHKITEGKVCKSCCDTLRFVDLLSLMSEASDPENQYALVPNVWSSKGKETR